MAGFSLFVKIILLTGFLTIQVSPTKVTRSRSVFNEKFTVGFLRNLLCDTCNAIVKLLNSGIHSLLLIERAKEIALPVCIPLIERLNYDAQKMCPGLLDAYTPPVVEILADFVFNPNTCETLRLCPSLESGHNSSLDFIGSLTDLLHNVDTIDNNKYTVCNSNVTRKPPTSKYNGRKVNGSKVGVETKKILQIADIHVDTAYAEGSPANCNLPMCCRWNYDAAEGSPAARKFGEHGCDLPVATLDPLITAMVNLNPDYVVYSGDSPPHNIWDESKITQFEIDKFIAKRLSTTFSGVQAFPTLGNHETYPSNLYYPADSMFQKFNADTLEIWKLLFTVMESQRETILKGAYYTKELEPGLRLLSINTQFWYNLNFYRVLNGRSSHYRDQLEFIEQVLSQARTDGEKVIISGHIAPGDFSSATFKYGKVYTDIVSRFDDVIVLQLFGHNHQDHFQLVSAPGDSTDLKGVAFLAPALTPYSGNNPAARIYHLDPTTFELLDYDQYYMDLETANTNNVADLTLLYSAKAEYTLPDMTPSSFYDLSKRLQDDTCVFNKYYLNSYVQSGQQPECARSCKLSTVCRTRSSSAEKLLRCMLGGFLRSKQ